MAKNSQRARPWNFACGHCCAGGHFTRDLRHKSGLLAPGPTSLHPKHKMPAKCPHLVCLGCCKHCKSLGPSLRIYSMIQEQPPLGATVATTKGRNHLGKKYRRERHWKNVVGYLTDLHLRICEVFCIFCAGTAIHKEHKMLAFIPLHFFPEPQSWPSPNEQWPSCSKGTCGRQRSPTDGIWLK